MFAQEKSWRRATDHSPDGSFVSTVRRFKSDVVSEDLVIVPDDDDLRFGNTSFSIAAWLSLPRSIPPCRLVQEDPRLYSASCLQPVLCKGDAFYAQGYCVVVSRVNDVGHAWVSLHLRDLRS